MNPPVPSISAELRALLRRLRLGKLLDTLPERAALARTHQLSHLEFLERVLSDEATRRDLSGASLRAPAAHLDAAMVLEAWDETAAVSYDRAIWSGLVSPRVVERAQNVLVSGGLADAELLRDCAALIGEVEERDLTRSWGRNSAGYAEQLRHVPAMDPAAIFSLPAFSGARDNVSAVGIQDRRRATPPGRTEAATSRLRPCAPIGAYERTRSDFGS